MIYGDPPSGRAAQYAATQTFVRSAESLDNLEITRTVERSEPNAEEEGQAEPGKTEEVTVTLRVENVDKQEYPSEQVVVTDTPPKDFDYVRGTARIGENPVHVVGVNPYYFYIHEELVPQQPVFLTYRAVDVRTKEE
jgi:hypothetical protein